MNLKSLPPTLIACGMLVAGVASAQETTQQNARWKYSSDALRPFWLGDVVEQESVLLLREDGAEEARGSLLFPISEIISVRSSSGETTYQAGVDYRFVPGTRELVIPAGSRVVTTLPSALRREANSQKHQLTHRDGNGEILFGAEAGISPAANIRDVQESQQRVARFDAIVRHPIASDHAAKTA